MQTFTVDDAQNTVDDAQKRFDEVLDIAEVAPVTIASDGKAVAAEEYKEIQSMQNRKR